MKRRYYFYIVADKLQYVSVRGNECVFIRNYPDGSTGIMFNEQNNIKQIIEAGEFTEINKQEFKEVYDSVLEQINSIKLTTRK